MKELRYTLVSEGSSDQALLPLLTWLLRENQVALPIQPTWADLRRLPSPPKRLPEKITISLELYPCDLLFVHRDADREPRTVRVHEIQNALCASSSSQLPPAVCVVPVRMLETWLLFNEAAIRQAAGNPRGHEPIDRPRLAELENLATPKEILYQMIRTASGRHGRRLKQLSVGRCVHLIANQIADFRPLRVLPAFAALESDVRQMILVRQWNQ